MTVVFRAAKVRGFLAIEKSFRIAGYFFIAPQKKN